MSVATERLFAAPPTPPAPSDATPADDAAMKTSPANIATLPKPADDKRETRRICGWTVHIAKSLLTEDGPKTERALELLRKQLEEIERNVPARAVAELKKVPLWISSEYPGTGPRAEYHPNVHWLRQHGRLPAMAKSVEFTNVRIFEQECDRMPNFALHELAHAYHDRVQVGGFGNAEIKAAYEKAKATGRYDRVECRHGGGRPNTFQRAYAMTDPQEYFAECTEAFFSRNDFFPFTRDELKRHDPETFALLDRLWSEPPPAAPSSKTPARVAESRSAGETSATFRGNGVIRAKAGNSEIVITTTERLGGAIHSLTWSGREFIDSYDHGRQLQSASSFDVASTKPFWSECFNPTEAGSRADGTGNRSSGKLLRFRADGAELQTTTQMAFWLAPGEKSFGRPALNDKVLSDHLLTKRVRIGYQKLAQVVDYEVTFTVPPGERHTYAQFEALTGYMPPEFSQFRKLNPTSGTLEALDDGPGEQASPVVFATRNGSHAMGVFSPEQPSRDRNGPGYGRFRFKEENVVKWNCVFRVRNAQGVAAGDYRFRIFVAVGTLEDVRRTLLALTREFAAR